MKKWNYKNIPWIIANKSKHGTKKKKEGNELSAFNCGSNVSGSDHIFVLYIKIHSE